MGPSNQRHRKSRGGALTGNYDLPEGVEVLAAFPGHIDGPCIHHLLPTECDLREEKPDGRVKPENRAKDLFGERHRPIPTMDVEEFVTCHPLLLIGGKPVEGRRHHDDRPGPAEGDGYRETVCFDKRHLETEAALESVHLRRQRNDRVRHAPAASEVHEADPDPRETEGRHQQRRGEHEPPIEIGDIRIQSGRHNLFHHSAVDG